MDTPEITDKNIIEKYYNDIRHSFSDYAIIPIIAMNDMDIMKGNANGSFAPKDNYTVEQAITTMLRLVEYK